MTLDTGNNRHLCKKENGLHQAIPATWANDDSNQQHLSQPTVQRQYEEFINPQFYDTLTH